MPWIISIKNSHVISAQFIYFHHKQKYTNTPATPALFINVNRYVWDTNNMQAHLGEIMQTYLSVDSLKNSMIP